MIAIAGGKGGCGKTTTALGLARALVAAGVPARVVDCDVGMPNLHRLADVDREPTLAAALGAGSGSASGARDAPVQVDDAGVEVVSAPRATADVDVGVALDALPDHRGVTLLDCPAGAGPDATEPLRAAAGVLLVAEHDAQSLEDARKTARAARRLDAPIVGAVLTRTRSASRSARATLPTERVATVPEVDAPLADPTVQRTYATVAQWLIEWTEQQSTQRDRAGGADGADLRRRRGRRSRRARGRGGAGSSSRGGGGPSGRR